MLHQPTIDKLHQMHLGGMLEELKRQGEQPNHYLSLSFEERLGHLVEQEWLNRENRRLSARLRHAKIRQSACIEDIDYQQNRGLDKPLVRDLARCAWVREKRNVLITGPAGAGKSYLACALAHQACREGFNVLYRRLSRLLSELFIAREEGREPRMLRRLAKTSVLVIDDWGLAPLGVQERHWLLEITEDRYDIGSLVITSQLPVKEWHGYIGDHTLADAILERVVHGAQRIEFLPETESVRKRKANLKSKEKEE